MRRAGRLRTRDLAAFFISQSNNGNLVFISRRPIPCLRPVKLRAVYGCHNELVIPYHASCRRCEIFSRLTAHADAPRLTPTVGCLAQALPGEQLMRLGVGLPIPITIRAASRPLTFPSTRVLRRSRVESCSTATARIVPSINTLGVHAAGVAISVAQKGGQPCSCVSNEQAGHSGLRPAPPLRQGLRRKESGHAAHIVDWKTWTGPRARMAPASKSAATANPQALAHRSLYARDQRRSHGPSGPD